MADFNTDLSPPAASGAAILQPVQPMNYGGAIEGISNIGKVVMDSFKNNEKNKQKELEDAVVADYMRKETALNTGIYSGAITSYQHAAYSRSNFNQFAASYPQYVAKFKEARDALKGNTELENTLEIEKSIQGARRNLIQQAVGAGFYIHESMDQATIDSQLNAYTTEVNAQKKAEELRKQSAEQRAERADMRAATEFTNKQDVAKTLQTLGGANFEAFQSLAASLTERARKGEDPVALQTILNQRYSTIEAGITAAASTNPDLASGWRTLFKDIHAYGMEGISGKAETDLLKKKFETAVMKAKIASVSDPLVMGLHVTTELMGPNVVSLYADKNKAALDNILRLTQTNYMTGDAPVVVNDPKQSQVSVDFLKAATNDLQNGKLNNPEEARNQLKNGANNLLRQLSYDNVTTEKMKPVMDFLSSPQYAYLLREGLIDKDSGTKAVYAFQKLYEAPLVGEVSRKLTNGFEVSRGLGKESIPVNQVVDIKFNGIGIDFVPKQRYFTAMEGENQRSLVRELESSKAALNQLITIGAHISGTTDYKRYWDDNKHTLVPGVYPDPVKLKVGQVINGMQYLGGNYKDPNNWVKQQGAKE